MKRTLLRTAASTLGILICLGQASAQQASRKPNHLVGVQSPYLQQHLYNAVDWYPWGEEALAKAKAENKPIFLSVGYSTCHWCHVMARESFENEAIGNFLNEHFVAIKVDRERRPDLDEQFMLATQALTGRGGWPNSLFLTSDAKPFYAATYLPPDAFLNISQQVAGLWKKDRATLLQEGDRVSTGIVSYMNRSAAAATLTKEAVAKAAASIIAQADEFNGGLGTAPKFPQESAMLFLLNQAERGDEAALNVVKDALDGMLMGGIHDHVGGGFHRYSVDPNWLVPHFEKMLYNQAMIGRLLVRTYALTGEYRYKHTAIRLFDYVIREMRDENGGFHSAQDADSQDAAGEEGEGLFYIWSKQEFDALSGPEFSVLKKVFEVTETGNFEGANIIHLAEQPVEIAAGQGLTEEKLFSQLDIALDKLRMLREQRHAPHKDKKIIVSWNAMMIETLALASTQFDRPDYYDAAKSAADYITSTMLNSEGLNRASFEGSIGVEGQLADYAGLGVALQALEDAAPEEDQSHQFTELAMRMAKEVVKRFADPEKPESTAFRMTEKADGLGNFAPVDDNPIPSGNSLALKLFDGIARREGSVEFGQRAEMLAAILSGHALGSPQSRGTLVNTAYGINAKPVGSTRHLASGKVRVDLKVSRGSGKVTVEIKLKPGWHINSNKPLEPYFIPTVMKVNGKPSPAATYPKPVEKKLGFNGQPLSLYEERLSLTDSFINSNGNGANMVELEIQACSDEICLEPERLQFLFWSS